MKIDLANRRLDQSTMDQIEERDRGQGGFMEKVGGEERGRGEVSIP
jgi:hypothetical protein